MVIEVNVVKWKKLALSIT